ncbi:MAG: metalloregulator ArsR/SmtB family transcription factor [Kiritimatiellae bacterium]|nr:metalloregulator ArsR/SmtB family transcription factor [Kiritimatiellia bacterium]
MASSTNLFRALADDVRLRLLNVVMAAELSVAELATVMGTAQPTVSRQLKILREAGLIEARREGTSIYNRRGKLLEDRELTTVLERRFSKLSTTKSDAVAIRRILDQRRKRSKDFFEKLAGRYGELTQPGGGWSALATGLAAGFSGQRVADLGCGEGALTLLLARFAKSVAAVDQSKAMLRLLHSRAKEAGVAPQVKTVESDFEKIALPGDAFDAVFFSQSLHHAARPECAIREAARLLRKGGTLVILDLARHDQEWVRKEWADQWMGFEEDELRAWLRDADLNAERVERLPMASATAPTDLTVLLVVGRKAGN